MHQAARVSHAIAALVIGAASVSACGQGEPRTDAERLARGREIVERMSSKLASAQAFSVTTHEIRTEVSSSGKPQELRLTREAVIRRPDRFYSRVSGDRQNDVWYDGVGITVVMHADKVFAQARAPETLDKTLDAIHERYGVSTPFADYAYSSPAKALIAETTTGGWMGRETIEGQQADHLAFNDKGVRWQLWVAATGDPVPLKAINEFSENEQLRKVDITFSNWNFAPQIASDRFTPTVPADYEGIAMLQRARVLRHVQDEPEAGPAETGVKK